MENIDEIRKVFNFRSLATCDRWETHAKELVNIFTYALLPKRLLNATAENPLW